MCGSSAPSGPSTSTTQTSNIPEYARPYVETMLGATQKQLFNTEQKTDPTTGQTSTEITGMKPYTPYSTNMNDYFAGPSPMQQQAYQGAANLGVAGQNDLASGMAAQAGLQGLGTQYDPMMARTQNFGMGAAANYMNPYAMSAMMPTLQEQARQSAIAGQGLQAKAVGQGAFGGSRQAIEQAENARNLGMLQNKTMTEGMNTAYNNAMQQFNADQARQLQAQQANIGQQQFGANLGMTGLQNALNAANQLGQLGQNQYNQQTGAINLQNQLGTQQQQLEQNKINQAIQNYATGQQWGMQQLSNMNAMLRGLPLQTTSTQTYQAAPSLTSQVAGLGLTGYGLSKMAAGGDVKETSAGLGAGALHRVLGEM